MKFLVMQYTPADVLIYVKLNLRFPEEINNTFIDAYVVFFISQFDLLKYSGNVCYSAVHSATQCLYNEAKIK